MIAQHTKDLYFLAAKWLALPNHAVVRLRYRNQKNLSLHLGCGTKYLSGFINIDANARAKRDAWLDLRNGLPFDTGSASFVYSSHVLEHLFPEEAIAVLREVRRVLSADGIARIAVPSMEHAREIMMGHDISKWPRAYEDPLAQAANYLFCDGQHKFAYSAAILQSFAQQAGFSRTHNYSAEHGCLPKRYGGTEVGGEPPGSLILELQP